MSFGIHVGSSFQEIGALPAVDVTSARIELETIHKEFASYPPSAIVWDFHDRTKHPPWGDDIDPSITSLANYFWTSDGKDLFAVLFEALANAERVNEDFVVQ